MDSVTLKKWSNFKYETKKEQKVLLEVDQYIVDKFQGAIERAENGELETFSEIFGEGTPEDPKLRMLMPYGTDDVEKFKVILEFLKNKEYARVINNLEKQFDQASPEERRNIGAVNVYDLFVAHPVYVTIKDTIKVNKKPLGWVEGDPIPTVDVDTANIYLNYRYKNFKGGGKVIETNQPFFKLLKQYAPEEVVWWQGDKKNNISGRQTFFTNNFEVTNKIAQNANDRGVDYYAKNYKDQLGDESNTVVLISRHPIDVLRMSDFSEAGIRSCHSPGADYFSNCQQEVASGGAIIFTVDKSKFLELFPDSIIPQKGEIFSDKDRRGIKLQRYQDPNKPMSFSDVKFAPKARLRLRRVEHIDDVSFAVPDTRIYGQQIASFRTQTFKYFGELQKNKFVSDGKPYLPKQDDLVRYGGEYEDGGEQNVGSNFALLAKTAMIYGGVDKAFFESFEWREYKQRLRYDSIQFGGGDPNEFEEEQDHTVELDRATSELFLAYARRFRNFSDGTVTVEPFYDYDLNDEENSISAHLTVKISVMIDMENIIDTDAFRDLNSAAVKYLKYEDMFGYNASMSWPSLDLDEVYTENNRVIFVYRGSYDTNWNNNRNVADTSAVESILDDFEKFLDEYCGDAESLAEDILRAFRDMGIAKPSIRGTYEEQINEIENLIDQNDEYFTIDRTVSKDTITYQKNLFTISSEGKGYSNDMRLIENKSEWIFKDLMKKNKDRIKKEVAQQLSLFGYETSLDMPAIFKSLDYLQYDAQLVLSAERTSAGASIGTSSEKIKIIVSIRLTVVINEQLEEENVQAAIGFVLALLNDQTTIDQIAVDTYKEALVNTGFEDYVTRIEETKKQRFKRLMREYAIKRRKGLV